MCAAVHKWFIQGSGEDGGDEKSFKCQTCLALVTAHVQGFSISSMAVIVSCIWMLHLPYSLAHTMWAQCWWRPVEMQPVLASFHKRFYEGEWCHSCAECPDMYWFAYAADPPAERHRRGLWAQQVDELASLEQELDGATSAQKEGSPLGMSTGCARACWSHLAEARDVVNMRMLQLTGLHWSAFFSSYVLMAAQVSCECVCRVHWLT